MLLQINSNLTQKQPHCK